MQIHPTADVSPHATIGQDTRIWNYAQIREGAVIGAECIIGRDVYVDADVQIGNRVKVQNSALLYGGAVIADGVFIGPRVCLTNDRYPRAITPDGLLKGIDDWTQGEIYIGYGASIGAGAIVVTGVRIGAFAMVAAGAVVTCDVPDYGLVMGVPARLVGFVCACGRPVLTASETHTPFFLAGQPTPERPTPAQTFSSYQAATQVLHHHHHATTPTQPMGIACADCPSISTAVA